MNLSHYILINITVITQVNFKTKSNLKIYNYKKHQTMSAANLSIMHLSIFSALIKATCTYFLNTNQAEFDITYCIDLLK